MGFSDLEKIEMKKMLRGQDQIMMLREAQIPEEIYNFLRTRGLFNQVADYGRFPAMKHKINSSENIELVKFFDADFQPSEFIDQLADILTPPFRIHLDCSMIISDPKGTLFVEFHLYLLIIYSR